MSPRETTVFQPFNCCGRLWNIIRSNFNNFGEVFRQANEARQKWIERVEYLATPHLMAWFRNHLSQQHPITRAYYKDGYSGLKCSFQQSFRIRLVAFIILLKSENVQSFVCFR
jgi:hypothetical protein